MEYYGGEDEVGQGVPARLFCPALGLAPKTVADTTRSDGGAGTFLSVGNWNWRGTDRHEREREKEGQGLSRKGRRGTSFPIPSLWLGLQRVLEVLSLTKNTNH